MKRAAKRSERTDDIDADGEFSAYKKVRIANITSEDSVVKSKALWTYIYYYYWLSFRMMHSQKKKYLSAKIFINIEKKVT